MPGFRSVCPELVGLGGGAGAGNGLLTNLVAYWKMDEASGTRNDSHGTNHLTDNNSTGSATGKINNAADLESSSSQYLSIADNSSVSIGDIDCAFQVWVNIEAKPANSMFIIGKWLSSNFEYTIYWRQASDRFSFAVTSSGAIGTFNEILANNLGSPSIGTWYLIHTWHDATANQIGIAVNAGTANTTTHNSGIFDGTAAMYFGRNQNAAGEHFDGMIDEAALWKNRTLSSGDRTTLYNSGNGLDYASFTT